VGATISEIKKALLQSGGLQSIAAEKLGISRSAICQRIAKSPKLALFVQEVREKTLDIAESVFLSEIRKGNLKAADTYLEKHGKDRGWGKELKLDASLDVKGGVLIVPGLIDENKWDEAAQTNGETEPESKE